MTDDQAKVFGALARGRLIFPLHDEREALHEAEKSGGLTRRESARKVVVDEAFDRVKAASDDFHAALEANDLQAAQRAIVVAIEVSMLAGEE